MFRVAESVRPRRRASTSHSAVESLSGETAGPLSGGPVAGGPAAVLRLQRAIGNRAVSDLLVRGRAPATAVQRQQETTTGASSAVTIQRVKDVFDVKLATDDLKLAAPFTAKHVAADANGAQTVTDNRYQSGTMPTPMLEGRMPNTVATQAAWEGALDASETKVDTEDKKWTYGVDLKVDGWEVTWDPVAERYVTVAKTGLGLKAGGYATARYRSKKSKEVVGGTFTLDHIGNG